MLISTRGRRLLDGEGVRAVQCFPTPSRASSLCLFRPSVGSGDGEGRQARASRTHALAGMSSQSQRGRSRAWFVRHGILPLVFSGCEPHTVPRADASFLLPGHSRSTARLAGGPWAESPTHLKPFFFKLHGSSYLGLYIRWTVPLGWGRGGLMVSLSGRDSELTHNFYLTGGGDLSAQPLDHRSRR